jgi:DNA-binding MarR family transcriptional regulator
LPFDHNESDDLSRARTGWDPEGGPLSRRLAHINLLQLGRCIKRGSDLVYARVSGLSDFEWRVLTQVCDMPGMSINEIGVATDRGVAQVSRTVKRLVGQGLVRRHSLGGGPGVAIYPTPLGERAYAPLVDVATNSERDLTQGLSDEELTTLHHVIAVMRRNALARLAKEQGLAEAASGAAR